METYFIFFLNNCIAATWLILIAILLRFTLRKTPKRIICFFWFIVGIRLSSIISINSILSLIPSAHMFNSNDLQRFSFKICTGFDFLDNKINKIIGSRYYEGVTVSKGTMISITHICTCIWVVGIIFFLTLFFVRYCLLHKKLKTAVKLRENIWQSEFVSNAFACGLFRPRIYIPFNSEMINEKYIIEHERMHIKHGDLWIKVIGYLLLIIYWYNPFIWLGYRLFLDDLEFACDEHVIKNLSIKERKRYSEILLNCCTNKNYFVADAIFFGNANVKERVSRILSYKTPSTILLIISIILCIVFAICFLTNPI